MAYEKWLEHVAQAQSRAAERLGVDVGTFKRPRRPIIPGYNDSEQEDTGTAQAAEPAQVTAPAPEPAVAQAVVEPAQVAQAEEPPAAAQPAAASSPAAERIAQAKARAAARKAGDGATAPPKPTPRPAAPARPAAPRPAPQVEPGREGMNRREFLTYAWGAAMALLTLEGGYVTFAFMYPRFREGEFGGKFRLGPAAGLPPVDASPKGITDGKFWLVNTEAGPKALYVVCTHLGCLYKWVEANNRFECPCHGSKFTREGYYIEGPAPRSLDEFVIYIQKGDQILAQTTEGDTDIIPPEITDPTAEVVVDTGKRILGKPKDLSPARVVKA